MKGKIMTREKLLEMIRDRKESAGGTLTDDDIYAIGMAHKELPVGDRDWEWLKEQIGWKGTHEGLRSFVKNRAYANNEVKPAPKVSLSEEEASRDMTKQKEELLKIKQNVHDEWSTYKRFLRDDARIDSLKEFITDAVSNLEPLDLSKNIDVSTMTKPTDREAIAMISDWHLGVECDDFSNTYNYDIATKRVAEYTQEVIDYCNEEHVKQLNVVNLGDLISGIIHPTIRLDQEFDVITQTIKAAELLANVLCEFEKNINAPIVYRSCTDNHARIMADKNESLEKENFFRLIDWFIEERLKDSTIKFANDNLSQDIGRFKLLNGRTVMFAHGHNDNANQAFQHFIGATGEFVDYVLLAHYHTEKMKNYQNMKVFINGSVVGTDPYAASKRLYNRPAQTLLVFDKDNVISHSIDLNIQK
jgi:hypothetical protein